MKKITAFLLFVCLGGFTWASPVDMQTAKTVGEHFLARKFAPGINVSLAKTYYNAQQVPTLYVFNINNADGFVIIAGDDAVQPVLAYSAESDFITENIPAHIQWWMNGYSSQISAVMAAHLTASTEVAAKWNQLLISGSHSATSNKPTGVAPLLTTEWDQWSPIYMGPVQYNNLCPVPGNDGDATPTGCVATSTAQVMNYWQWPAQGTGMHSYEENDYGTLSANFANTTYDWDNMPVSATEPATWNSANTNAVATLMYQIGIAVEMDYDIGDNGGSGAICTNYGYDDLPCAQNALTDYFNYDPSQQGIERADYTDEEWKAAIKNSLDSARPVIYAGQGDEGGHQWVVDGYDDDDYFHCNWGWSGYSDGNFTIDNMSPEDLGAGGGDGGFNSDQEAIVQIHPLNSVTPPPPTTDTTHTYGDLVINASLGVTPTAIYWNQTFTVTSQLFNNTDSSFQGDYTAAIYRSSDSSFVSYLQTFTNQDIASQAQPDVTFHTTGVPGMTPGNYFVKLLYRKKQSTQWILIPVADSSIINHVNITVMETPTGTDDINADNLVKMYPNPASDYINIAAAGFGRLIRSVEVYNIDGKRIDELNSPESGDIRINTGGYASGAYFVRIYTDAGIACKKVIVRH